MSAAQPWDAFGKNTPLGKLLHDIYNPRKNSAVFHDDLKASARKGKGGCANDPRPRWGQGTGTGTGTGTGKGKGKGKGKASVAVPRVGNPRSVGGYKGDDIEMGRRYGVGYPRGVRPSIRTKDAILSENPYEVEQYRPTPNVGGVDRNGKRIVRGGDDEKKRLQERLSRREGADSAEENRADAARARADDAAGSRKKKNLSVHDQLTEDLLREIDERKSFIADMRRLGTAAEYEVQIKAEIAERVRRLREIEKRVAADH